MAWVFVDVAIGVLALLGLGLVGFTLYTRVRALKRATRTASERVASASTGLSDRPSGR